MNKKGRKEKIKDSRAIYLKKKEMKNRGISELDNTPPTILPSFENTSSIITDNEYEIDSEIIDLYKKN